jgi:DegT/DnrJ/EryC1/StrS aminotransferase family protein
MTTGGEGGMMVTNDSSVYERAWAFKDHGKNHSRAHANNDDQMLRWLHDSIGTNWRMTELQAAIGCRQLRKVPGWLEQRRRNASILAARLSQLSALRIPVPPNDVSHAFYRFCAFVRPEMLKPRLEPRPHSPGNRVARSAVLERRKRRTLPGTSVCLLATARTAQSCPRARGNKSCFSRSSHFGKERHGNNLRNRINRSTSRNHLRRKFTRSSDPRDLKSKSHAVLETTAT